MPSPVQHERICNDLVNQGWSVVDNFFDPELTRLLANECRQLATAGKFSPAGIGRAEHRTIDNVIRGDQIGWLEAGMAPGVDRFLGHIEELRIFFNRQLFLGLEDVENHFAVYPKGAFYQKHLDRFQHSDSRVISSVLYLNQNWQSEHGGQLRLHLDDGVEDIEPIANRLVLFISAQIVHEVLPTEVERLSLTGWFRRH